MKKNVNRSPHAERLLAPQQKKTGQRPVLTILTSYCNLNIIGILNGTRTGRPRCLPGVILGNLEIIR